MASDSVLFLTYWYPNKNNKSFGIFVKRHAHAIKLKNNITVLSLIILKGPALFKKSTQVFTDEMNVETHQLYLESRFYKLLYVLLPLHYLILKWYTDTVLKPKNKFTLLHANIIFPCGIVAWWLSKRLRCKLVITEHWTKIDKFFRVSVYRFAGKKAYNKAGAITAVSSQLAATLKKHTGNPAIHIVPNVIDTAEFYYDLNASKNKTLTFIAVANWGQHKNPFYFLNALQQLKKEGRLPDFRMVIVGKGEQIQKIKDANYNFEIDFKLELSSADVCRELNASHIFLHGSDFETFSVIIAEALMCGLPSVVSPVGIGPDVINKSNGFVTNNTPEDWKEKILACYQTNYNNQQISEQLKNKYSLDTVGKLFTEIYRNL